ncbi:HEXXH motif-containing putative peptide modification protein [Nonomuraea sp. 3-1Str]|uniref:aKG-HExxH-type peptide beta-hydroxylase n=1 Tax=Nonomuraea sp. 3-1Str TaxID=2929801 RepID=UPI002854A311|nr:HEXXH motif-containing putative peptide modification protein [Nonomuraea sp. 3-1Str]MDR8407363.1 HEXXH motif-containing putative peptide modification protein [Nonomuraea sp. 3-1Str]
MRPPGEIEVTPVDAVPNDDLISRIDLALGSDPRFGDAAAIETRNLARHRLGLGVLARHHPGAAGRLERLAQAGDAELRPLMYDPVLRNAFENDLTALERGAGQIGALAGFLESGVADTLDGVGPCERLSEPRVRPWPGAVSWVWTDLHPSSGPERELSARLEELLAGTLSQEGSGGRVRPDAGLLSALTRAAALLGELLPRTGAGVLPHVSLTGFVRDELADGALNSISGGDPLPSALFLAPERLDDPWTAAETLFHEGLHLKLFDVLRTGSMVADADQMVPIPWRVRPWTLTRVLFALHVYAHLLLFQAAAAAASPAVRSRYGTPPATAFADRATPGSPAAAEGTHTTGLERVAYLARQAALAYGEGLTDNGRRFVDWLVGAVSPLAPVHLPVPAPSRPAQARPDVRPEVELEARGYRQARPVHVCPIPEQGQLVAVSPGTPRFQWLNGHAWLLYALCDGGDLTSLRARYREAAGPDADAGLGAGLAGLLSAGLIEPVGA